MGVHEKRFLDKIKDDLTKNSLVSFIVYCEIHSGTLTFVQITLMHAMNCCPLAFPFSVKKDNLY